MLFQQNSGNANHNWMAGTDSSKQNYVKGVAIAGGGLLVWNGGSTIARDSGLRKGSLFQKPWRNEGLSISTNKYNGGFAATQRAEISHPKKPKEFPCDKGCREEDIEIFALFLRRKIVKI
jgi:hypothetical protein